MSQILSPSAFRNGVYTTKWAIRRFNMNDNRTLSNPQETFLIPMFMRTHRIYACIIKASETHTYSSFPHK
jgi:hypothetical protein